MENPNIHNLAEKIAVLLQAESAGTDFSALQVNLEKLSQRLNRIESQMALPHTESQKSNQLHSSQEKFANLEDFAEQSFNGQQTEKACPYEPTGKPCDQCAMCSARGF